jgi:hypothetical protein
MSAKYFANEDISNVQHSTSNVAFNSYTCSCINVIVSHRPREVENSLKRKSKNCKLWAQFSSHTTCSSRADHLWLILGFHYKTVYTMYILSHTSPPPHPTIKRLGIPHNSIMINILLELVRHSA